MSPTFLFTLDAIIIPLISYVLPELAQDVSKKTSKHSLKNRPRHVTLFSHGLNLVAHTLSHIGIARGPLNVKGVTET